MFRKSGQYVWIVGAQRSGTTHIAQCIANHPDTGITIEGKLFYYCMHWLMSHFDPTHIRFDEIAHGLARRYPQNLDPDQLAVFFDTAGKGLTPQRIRDVSEEEAVFAYHESVYQAVFPHAQIVGDKYNEYLLSLEDINRCFPNSRFIFIHRAPLFSAASMIEVFADRTWCPISLADAVEKWATWNDKWLHFRKSIDPSRWFEIAYSDFRSFPSDILKSVFEFLELPDNPDVRSIATKTTRLTETRQNRQFVELALSSHATQVAGALGYELMAAETVVS